MRRRLCQRNARFPQLAEIPNFGNSRRDFVPFRRLPLKINEDLSGHIKQPVCSKMNDSMQGPVELIGEKNWREPGLPSFDSLASSPPADDDRANCRVRHVFPVSFENVIDVHLLKFPTPLEPYCLGTELLSVFTDDQGRGLTPLSVLTSHSFLVHSSSSPTSQHSDEERSSSSLSTDIGCCGCCRLY